MERIGSAGLVMAGLLIAAGLVGSGWLLGRGMVQFRSDVRTVTVKGLVERDAKSEEAEWRLGYRRAGNTLPELYTGARADREAIVAFLKKRGFQDTEIELPPTRTLDKLAQDYADGNNIRFRYVVTGAVVLRTKKVDAVQATLGSIDSLAEAGVALDPGDASAANPRYILTGFNDLRPQLLADATKNARATAQQFASDSGATVGDIVSANQGNIQIFGSDGHDE